MIFDTYQRMRAQGTSWAGPSPQLHKDIDSIENDDEKTQWNSNYDVISDVYFRQEEPFPKIFILRSKNMQIFHRIFHQEISKKSKTFS